MVLVAILNGSLRESILNPMFSTEIALPISGLLLSVMIFLVTYLFIGWFNTKDPKTFIQIGGFWSLLTIGFEYGFGYFVLHHSLNEIHQVFNVFQGNLFSLALLTSILSPWLAAKLKRLI